MIDKKNNRRISFGDQQSDRNKPVAAAYFAPTQLEEALALMAEQPCTLVAGGTDYFPARGRQPESRSILDLTHISPMKGIKQSANGAWRIGGLTTWSELIAAELPPAFDGLKAAAREVGAVQIQNAGTIAGNICNASPAADGVPPLLTLDASVELTQANGSRVMPLDAFLQGPRQTDLQEGEILTAIYVPSPPISARSAFEKAGARKFLVISITMTAVMVVESNGTITDIRIAVGACAPVAKRLSALEKDLIGRSVTDIMTDLSFSPEHLAPLAPISDIRGDEDYRMDAVPTQIIRAIRSAISG